MNIENRLIELTQETLYFGNLINATENHDNSDYQNACKLFGQYLDDQLNAISTYPIAHNSYMDTKAIAGQLHMLGSLIAQGQLSTAATEDWSRKLSGFCSQLQLRKSNAA